MIKSLDLDGNENSSPRRCSPIAKGLIEKGAIEVVAAVF